MTPRIAQTDPRAAYLARFPDAESLLGIAGFSFFVIRPVSARFVGGFAQATTLTPESFGAAIRTG